MFTASPQLESFLPDECAERCFKCHSTFHQFNRRHHCRLCMKIFCSGCSSRRAKIPSFLRVDDDDGELRAEQVRMAVVVQQQQQQQQHRRRKPRRPGEPHESSPINIPGQAVRVCARCNHKIGQFNVCHTKILEIRNHTLDKWGGIARRGPAFSTAVQFLRERLMRVCQRFFETNERHKTFDLRLVQLNAHLLQGHGRLDIHMAQAGIAVPPARYQALLSGKTDEVRRRPCAEVGCDGCEVEWPLTNCIHALHTLPTAHVLHRYAVRRLGVIFEQCPADVQAFIPTLAWLSPGNASLLKVLPALLCANLDMAIECYWYCRAHPLLFTLQNAIFTALDEDVRREISLSREWVTCFENACTNFDDEALAIRVGEFARTRRPWLPGGRGLRVVDVLSRRRMASHTRPVLTEIVVVRDGDGDGDVVGVGGAPKTRMMALHKSENIDNDRAIMCVHRLMSRTTGIRENNIPVPMYSVIPLTPNTGMMVFSPNVVTLSELHTRNDSVLAHLAKTNAARTLGAVTDDVVKSCAYSGMLSYVFGYGDRHMNNMLLLDSGEIVHIDFAFLFGRESNHVKQFFNFRGIPITKSIQQVLKHRHAQFVTQCLHVSQMVADHSEALYWCMWPLVHTTDLEKTELKKYFMTYVIGISNLGEDEVNGAITSLVNHSTTSSSAWTTTLMGFVHDAAEFWRHNH
jgi:hypothetical protein